MLGFCVRVLMIPPILVVQAESIELRLNFTTLLEIALCGDELQ